MPKRLCRFADSREPPSADRIVRGVIGDDGAHPTKKSRALAFVVHEVLRIDRAE